MSLENRKSSQMAEVIGFASAGVGVASFAVQILGSLSALRDAYQYNRNEAPQELQHLTSRLEFLKQLLEHLQPFEGNPIIDHPIAICQSTYNGMEKDLIVLLDRMHGRSATRKTDLKSVKLFLSGRTRKKIEEIGNKIDSMTIMMNAYVAIHPRRREITGSHLAQAHYTWYRRAPSRA